MINGSRTQVIFLGIFAKFYGTHLSDPVSTLFFSFSLSLCKWAPPVIPNLPLSVPTMAAAELPTPPLYPIPAPPALAAPSAARSELAATRSGCSWRRPLRARLRVHLSELAGAAPPRARPRPHLGELAARPSGRSRPRPHLAELAGAHPWPISRRLSLLAPRPWPISPRPSSPTLAPG
jgi:hypothetical protein